MEETSEREFTRALRLLAPGTSLREGLDHILAAHTGALIVIGPEASMHGLMEGGFELGVENTPARLYELAKMDGAILISEDGRRILHANVQLLPDSRVVSFETGIRHRTAERVARQTGNLVIAISQRRHRISAYMGSRKHVLRDLTLLLAKASQALQTLDRYRSALDDALDDLTSSEFDDLVILAEVCTALQRAEAVRRVAAEIERYTVELGVEGRLVVMQAEELAGDVAEEERRVIRDYAQDGEEEPFALLSRLSTEGLMEPIHVARILGYAHAGFDTPLHTRGYRILSKIPRLPQAVVENLVKRFGSLERVMQASVEELDAVEGIGEVRARSIHEGLRRMREQAHLHRRF